MKIIKINILIQICLLPIMLFIVFWFSLYSFVSSVDSKIMKTFQHNNHIVYSNGSSIIYNESKLEIISNIKNSDDNNIKDSNSNSFSYKDPDLEIISIVEWIDDNHIIYSKEEDNSKNYYLLDSNENTSLLYSSNDLDEYGVIYKDSILYFISSDNTYNKYENDTLTKINKSDYYKIRDGNKYEIILIVRNNNKNVIMAIIDNIIYEINRDMLSNSEFFVHYSSSNLVITDYTIVDDKILIHAMQNNYVFTFIFNYKRNKVEFYDYVAFEKNEHDKNQKVKIYNIANSNSPILDVILK